MGNQASAPSSQPSGTISSPPSQALPPTCDLPCQRQRQLDGLQSALDTATLNKNAEPEAYEQARVAYYTLLNGQGWLTGEKDRIAKQEIEPILTDLNNQFKGLQDKKKQQAVYVNLSSALSAQDKETRDEVKFLNTSIAKEIASTDVLNRLTQLKTVPEAPQESLFYLLYIIVALLMVYTVYLFFSKVASRLMPSQPTVGGKKSKT